MTKISFATQTDRNKMNVSTAVGNIHFNRKEILAPGFIKMITRPNYRCCNEMLLPIHR